MRTGFVVLAGLMALESAATGLKLDTSSCKLAKKVQREEVECPCAGGSGNYDWHFDNLPDNWRNQRGRLFTHSGKFDQRKVFGTKVEVIDKVSRQSVKRSLFFTVENGKINKAADHDYDFDVTKLVQDKRDRVVGNFEGFATRTSDDDDRVRRVFDGAEGIGGGNGLKRLRPYFGGRGLYQGDDKNPFRDRLPTFEQVDRTLETGRSRDVRELVVNTARSKLSCGDVGGFLEKVFRKVRGKIGLFKDDLESTKKNTRSVQDQLQFLSEELKKTQTKETNIKELLAQLQKLKLDSLQIQEDREKLKISLQQANQQIELFQAEIARNVESVRKIKVEQEEKARLVNRIDLEITELQQRIKQLNDKKAIVTRQSESNRVILNDTDNKNKEIQVKVDALRIAVKEIREKLKVSNENLESVQAKILEAQKTIKLADNQQRNNQIRQKVNALRESLTTSRSRINGVEPAFRDLTENYDDIERIRDHHFNRCYRTYFNDDRDQFREDDDDGIEFNGREDLDRYIQKVYGKSRRRESNIRFGESTSSVTGQSRSSFSGSVQGGNRQGDERSKNQKVKMKRTHILSPTWTKAHGSVYDDNFDEQRGRRFAQNDFECDIGNIVNVGSFNGKVVSINKNIAKVTNEKGEQCTLYLGGCTRVESVNKLLPKAGDQVYWKGTWKNGREYNAHHVTCI